MTDAKIKFAIGDVSFEGEGEQEWVTAQLDKIIEKAPDLIKLTPQKHVPLSSGTESPQVTGLTDTSAADKTLATFLREKGVNKVQVKKFLATAVWLHAKGKSRLKTSDVNAAIKEAQQSRLGNASDCLNRNVTKGFAEKDGNEFFITEDGKSSI